MTDPYNDSAIVRREPIDEMPDSAAGVLNGGFPQRQPESLEFPPASTLARKRQPECPSNQHRIKRRKTEEERNADWIAAIELQVRQAAESLEKGLCPGNHSHSPSYQDLVNDVISETPSAIVQSPGNENARSDLAITKGLVQQYQHDIFEANSDWTDVILRKLRFIDSYDIIERYPFQNKLSDVF